MVEKAPKRKDDKLYDKWKSYDNSFDSCIDKRDIGIQNDLLSRTTYSQQRQNGNKIRFKLDLSNYATKSYLKTSDIDELYIFLWIYSIEVMQQKKKLVYKLNIMN